nr:hypothetical protein [Salmonid herpesvirus 1]
MAKLMDRTVCARETKGREPPLSYSTTFTSLSDTYIETPIENGRSMCTMRVAIPPDLVDRGLMMIDSVEVTAHDTRYMQRNLGVYFLCDGAIPAITPGVFLENAIRAPSPLTYPHHSTHGARTLVNGASGTLGQTRTFDHLNENNLRRTINALAYTTAEKRTEVLEMDNVEESLRILTEKCARETLSVLVKCPGCLATGHVVAIQGVNQFYLMVPVHPPIRAGVSPCHLGKPGEFFGRSGTDMSPLMILLEYLAGFYPRKGHVFDDIIKDAQRMLAFQEAINVIPVDNMPMKLRVRKGGELHHLIPREAFVNLIKLKRTLHGLSRTILPGTTRYLNLYVIPMAESPSNDRSLKFIFSVNITMLQFAAISPVAISSILQASIGPDVIGITGGVGMLESIATDHLCRGIVIQ